MHYKHKKNWPIKKNAKELTLSLIFKSASQAASSFALSLESWTNNLNVSLKKKYWEQKKPLRLYKVNVCYIHCIQWDVHSSIILLSKANRSSCWGRDTWIWCRRNSSILYNFQVMPKTHTDYLLRSWWINMLRLWHSWASSLRWVHKNKSNIFVSS